MKSGDLRPVVEATWPAAASFAHGPWLIREGQGGGKRASAASALPGWNAASLALAESAMIALNQSPLFVVYPGDEALDAMLAQQGYGIIDPVAAYAAALADLCEQPPEPMTTFPHWPPMAIATELWAEAGIGAGRLAVMDRVRGPKTAILGRSRDRASGVAFVAIHENIAMLHALEVTPSKRRQGSAHNILRAAALWAHQNGANQLSLVVTEANENARRLYASLGMSIVGHYHYRQK